MGRGGLWRGAEHGIDGSIVPSPPPCTSTAEAKDNACETGIPRIDNAMLARNPQASSSGAASFFWRKRVVVCTNNYCVHALFPTRVICQTPSIFRPWVTVASISQDFFGICRIFLDRSTD